MCDGTSTPASAHDVASTVSCVDVYVYGQGGDGDGCKVQWNSGQNSDSQLIGLIIIL
jgi:hypothetical protein